MFMDFWRAWLQTRAEWGVRGSERAAVLVRGG